MSGPLSGVRVLDLCINVLGPLSCQILGDMGADVIKIEPPTGDTQRTMGPMRNPKMSGFFLNLNRSKRSVVLNLKNPAALEALMKLVDDADVLVHSMRLSAAERLGIGYEALSRRNPRLIYACATGYSPSGPKADLPAYDDVTQGQSGIADMMERSMGVPAYVPMPFVDKFCGHAQASAIAMALYARERTGRGQAVYTPMLESIVAFNMVEHWWGTTFDPPLDGPGYPRMFVRQRRPFPTSDGLICMLAHSDDQWKKLFQALDVAELCDDPRFVDHGARTRNVADLYQLVGEAFKRNSTAHWRARLDAADVPNGEVARLEDLVRDSYLHETGFLRYAEHPSEGSVLSVRPPTEFSLTPAKPERLAPVLGEHSSAVLGEIGYSQAEIDALARP